MSKKALGRGLSSLVPETYINTLSNDNQTDNNVDDALEAAGVREIAIGLLEPGTHQPRKFFSDNTLKELADSIQEKGIIQPLVVKSKGTDRYQIVCGERRFRAAQLAGLKTLPVVVKDLAGNDILEVALIENIQREDLNPVEEAQAYQRLQDEGGLTHDVIAKRVGKDRATVTNSLRLLKLPPDILDLIVGKKISGGHARALVAIPHDEQQRFMARRIVSENLSVRQTEKLIQQKAFKKRKAKVARKLDTEIIHLETLIQQKLGTKVKVIAGKKNRGKLEISYTSLDELDRILDLMGVYRS